MRIGGIYNTGTNILKRKDCKESQKMSTSATKGVKKVGTSSGASSNASSTTASPAQQKILGDMIQKEQQSKEMQSILEMFADIKINQQRIEETIGTNQARLENKMEEINQQITTLTNQISEINQEVQQNKIQIQQLDQKSTQNSQQIEALKQEKDKTQEILKKYEEATLTIEMDRASNILRFRNIPENNDMGLLDQMEEALVEFLDIEKSQMSREIAEIFRINSSFARRNKMPRDVHITFLRRKIKEDILKRSRENPLKIQGEEIVVLKQIPWKIQEIRKQYFFLTKKLNEKDINFRWIIPCLLYTSPSPRD